MNPERPRTPAEQDDFVQALLNVTIEDEGDITLDDSVNTSGSSAYHTSLDQPLGSDDNYEEALDQLAPLGTAPAVQKNSQQHPDTSSSSWETIEGRGTPRVETSTPFDMDPNVAYLQSLLEGHSVEQLTVPLSASVHDTRDLLVQHPIPQPEGAVATRTRSRTKTPEPLSCSQTKVTPRKKPRRRSTAAQKGAQPKKKRDEDPQPGPSNKQ